MHKRGWWLVGAVACAAGWVLAGGKLVFDESLIPRFNVPRTARPPTIDGRIDPAEWQAAARVTGVVSTHSLAYKDRDVTFWLAWDAQHLYVAARSDVLPGHRLYRASRERHTTEVVFDDAYEFGIFMHDRNKPAGEHPSFLKMVVNSLGAGEYMKIYPSIGQNMYNWQPDNAISNRVYEADGRRWWDFEMAMDLADLQMPVENRAGDKLDMLLAADLKNPGWQWLDFPSASGHLEHYGFPRLTLTDAEPYVQVERLGGLHDEKLDLRLTVHNPSGQPVTVEAMTRITHTPPKGAGDPATVVDETRALTVPAGGSTSLNVTKAFPGLAYSFTKWGAPENGSRLTLGVRRPDAPAAAPVYAYTCDFSGTNKSYLVAEPRTTVFEYERKFNPADNRLFLAGDTLDAAIPVGSAIAAMTYAVERDGKRVVAGRVDRRVNLKFEAMLDLPVLAPGTYRVTLAFVDAAGQVLVSRNDITFDKKDEARAFARWWKNRIADTEKVLKPFEALKVSGGRTPRITCTRRDYELGSLGLPMRITANGGPVLGAPARVVVTIGGREFAVPTDRPVKITSKTAWRVEFGGSAEAGGVAFSATGWMEQDGLVNLDLTYAASGAGAVAIEDLRVEWPVDGRDGSWMSCIGGVGGNYSPRTIDRVPAGQGQVWDTLTGIGKAGSKMLIGNWENNLWVGNEIRGLCWFGDDDRGWVPNDQTPAHSLFRDGQSVVIRNHIIRLPPGAAPFVLDAPRTIRLQYNATPFRHLAPGWRLTQVSAANGFSSPTWKANEKENNKEYFSILSMPSRNTNEWAYYLAKYQATANTIAAKDGWNSVNPRLHTFLNNQIALRGYMDKTLEPGLYDYFNADWIPGNESLNATYRDYMIQLMDLHVREGGLAHYYFDISFSQSLAAPIAGFGYFLPDGRAQPGSMDGPLREWYKRVWALMQEHDLYPGGVSGHATHSICLRALPWTDAILDSEYPMQDPITVYPSDAMIAMSCPHAFGVNISHLGFMHPDWAALHDAGMGGSGFPFNSAAFRHFGIAAADVQFVPYWRNQAIVKQSAPGILASIWKRPGKAIVQVLNHEAAPEGEEPTRTARLALDLKALGVMGPVDAATLRIREIQPGGGRISAKSAIFDWYAKLPDSPRWAKDEQPKLRPAASPRLDPATGVLDGVDLFYHDSRYIEITWDDRPVSRETVAAAVGDTNVVSALAWGFSRAKPAAAGTVAAKDKRVGTKAWTQPGTALVVLQNGGEQTVTAELTADLGALGVQVPKLWAAYTQCLGGELNPTSGVVTVKGLMPGEQRLVFIDTYAE